MIELAVRYGDPAVRLKDVAQCQDIPLAYLRELMTVLSAAGLVRSVRGPRGGYVLTRSPEEVRVLDVVEPLEGSLTLVDCTAEEALCERSPRCAARGFWCRLAEELRGTLSGTTLADLAALESASAEGTATTGDAKG